jgi:hypothetical protein
MRPFNFVAHGLHSPWLVGCSKVSNTLGPRCHARQGSVPGPRSWDFASITWGSEEERMSTWDA